MRFILTAVSPKSFGPHCKAKAKPLSSPQCLAYFLKASVVSPLASIIVSSATISLYVEPAYLKTDSAITFCQLSTIISLAANISVLSEKFKFLPPASLITLRPSINAWLIVAR